MIRKFNLKSINYSEREKERKIFCTEKNKWGRKKFIVGGVSELDSLPIVHYTVRLCVYSLVIRDEANMKCN